MWKELGMSTNPRLMRKEKKFTARTVSDISDTTEETLNVNDNSAVPVEETESAKNTEK